MKKIITSSLAVITLLILTAGVTFSQSKETRDLSGFREVNFGISGNLYITIGSAYKVTLEGDADYLSEIKTVVKDGKLQIRRENYRLFNNEKADIYITMPALSGLGISGSGKAKVEGNIEADAFSLSVSGSGKVYVADLSADSFGCSISGSGDVIIEGKGSADKGKITISGSGNYSGPNFEIDNLSVNISGSGGCDCKAGDTLIARISGSGNVNYYGQPKLDVRASGSGHVRSK